MADTLSKARLQLIILLGRAVQPPAVSSRGQRIRASGLLHGAGRMPMRRTERLHLQARRASVMRYSRPQRTLPSAGVR